MTWILIALGVVALIAVLGWLLKSFVKMIILLAIIYGIYQVAFVWNAGQLATNLHLNSFLSPQTTKTVMTDYTDFTKKRSQNSVVQANLVSEAVTNTMKQSMTNASNQVNKVNKEQLIQNLAKNLQHFDPNTVTQVLNQMSSELAKYGVTPQDVTNAQKGK